jgi:hypothetical protein
MTYSKSDVLNFKNPRKTEILNANGVSYPIIGE